MAQIELEKIAVRFKSYQGRSVGLKEAFVRLISPPRWEDKIQNQSSDFWGLKEVSLSLSEGDRLGIIGRNGAGKSTLLKVMARIYRPTLGSVSVQGRLAALIEIGAGFHPELSGRENAYLNGSILGLTRKTISEHMDSIFGFSGLSEFIDMPVKYYSTGMYLRLAFTVATEIAPDILILDELYAGGDSEFIEKANRRLDQFVSKTKILILVAHQMGYIHRFCNKVVWMDDGKIKAIGTPEEIIQMYLSKTTSC